MTIISLCSRRWLHVRNPGLRVSHTVLQQTRSLGRLNGQFHQSLRIASSLARLSSTSTRPEARKSWVEHLPPQIRPYLYLMRIDKPIGTLLLFYPCGQPFFFQILSIFGFDI
jgi:4-hydroxybenzoate polyprenyltransferase